jgi:transposase
MPQERTVGKPTTRRYSVEEKQAAVRMVRALQAETGITHAAVRRVADSSDTGSSRSARGSGKRTSMTECARA